VATGPAPRPLTDLLSDDPAWPLVQSWLAEATNDVRVLPADRERAERTLYELQVTSRSPLGAVALETGGIVVDRGWLRILGSGSDELRASLATWNRLTEREPEIEPLQGALLVAFDAVGGFFAGNGGAFEGEVGNVFYCSPDTLEWDDLECGYSEFLQFAFTGDLALFYEGLRWNGWEAEVAGASHDEGFALYPPPFTKEGKPVDDASRSPVPMHELWSFYRDVAAKIAHLPEGASVSFRVTD